MLADCSPAEREALALLEQRIGRTHLRQRLGLEGEHEAHVVRRGTHFFHLENWVSVHRLLRMVLAASGLLARGRRNALRISLRRQEVCLPGLPAAFDGCTLLHLSDLHIDMSPAHLERLIERVSGLQADACVLTGDYRFSTFGPHQPALDAMARLRPHLPGRVLAVLGNHDSVRMVPGLQALGITVLMNEWVALQRGGEQLVLAGIDDAHYFRTHNFHKAAEGMPHPACAILLSHTPEAWRHAAHAGYALMLCGHTHGGQICLPGGMPLITDSSAPRFTARGAWRHAGMQGYTSVGCGSSILDVRLNCPPEVTLHTLRCAAADDQ